MKKNTSIISFVIALMSIGPAMAQIKDTTSVSYYKPLFDFEVIKPVFKLLEEQAINKNRFLRFSALTGYRQGLPDINAGWGMNFNAHLDKESGTIRFYMFNLSLQEMLTHGMLNSSRVILDVKDPSKYRYEIKYGPKEEWLRKNGYCFEFMLPMGSSAGSKIMEDEICRLFNLKIYKNEKRLVNTLVLVRTSDKDKLKSKGIGETYGDKNGNFNNVNPVSALSAFLYEAALPPLVDETGYSDPMDLKLNITDWKDLAAIRKALQRYDLDLKEEKREFKMFVIQELDIKK